MGIEGLLKELRDVTVSRHVSEYAGLRVAVDAQSWLHAGVSSCALELATGTATQKHIQYCLARVELLKQHALQVLLVFDGAQLPAKRPTNMARRQRRQEHCDAGERLLAVGDLAGARRSFAQGVEVGPDMVAALAQALVDDDTPFIIAPYEADAQLAFLSQQGYVDVCISEDSDLLTYGCRKVLFKMDREGSGQEIALESALRGLSFEEFQAMCVMLGCDYLPRVPGIGPKNALRLAQAAHNSESKNPHRVLAEAEASGFQLPENYVECFDAACMVFRHQMILDIDTGHCMPLTPLPAHLVEAPPVELLGPPQSRPPAVHAVMQALEMDESGEGELGRSRIGGDRGRGDKGRGGKRGKGGRGGARRVEEGIGASARQTQGGRRQDSCWRTQPMDHFDGMQSPRVPAHGHASDQEEEDIAYHPGWKRTRTRRWRQPDEETEEIARKTTSDEWLTTEDAACQAIVPAGAARPAWQQLSSPFISEHWVPPRPRLHQTLTLAEFVQREHARLRRRGAHAEEASEGEDIQFTTPRSRNSRRRRMGL